VADVKKVVELEIDVDTGDVKQLNKETKEVSKNLKGAKKGTSGLAGGFKKVGTAIKAAGIGLLLATLAKLVEVFKTNQGAIDGFQTGMNALTIAFNDFFGFIDDNLGTVIDYFKGIFEDPVGAMKSFGRSLKTEVLNRIKQFGESLGILGKAIKKFFLGDWDEAWTLAKEAAVAAVDVITGEDGGLETLKSAFDRVKTSIVDYTKSVLEAGAATVELQKAAELAEIQQQGLIELYDREAEILRQNRDDFTKSFAERIAANEKLGEVLRTQNEEELKLIDIRQRALEDQLNKGLIPEFEAKKQLMILDNERAEIAARVTGFESEQQLNKISLLKEEADLKQAAIDADLEAKKKAAEEEMAFAQKVSDAKIDLAKKSINTAITLNELFVAKTEAGAKLQFRITKALRLSEAVITGVQSTINAFNSAASNVPATAASLGNYPFIQAAAAGVFAAGNIATIAATQFNGGAGGGGMATASRSAPSTTSAIPSFDTIGSSGTNQLSEAIASQNNQPMRAYVVANDVNSAQSLERNRQSNATFP